MVADIVGGAVLVSDFLLMAGIVVFWGGDQAIFVSHKICCYTYYFLSLGFKSEAP